MKKIVVALTITVVGLCFNIVQYQKIEQLQEQYEIAIENQVLQIKNDDLAEVESVKESVALKGDMPIYVHATAQDYYDGDTEYYNFSVVGPLAMLTGNYTNQENNHSVEVIGEKGEYFTKIFIEGYIPTWYIRGVDDTESIEKLPSEEKYMIVDDAVYFGASETSGIAAHLFCGDAVEVIGEYEDWYYIKQMDDMSVFSSEMWVKKESVGDFEALESKVDTLLGVDVKLLEGTTVAYGDFAENETFVLEKTRIGYIFDEDELYYYVSFPGTELLTVCKEGVQFIGK
ncbi:hypothetical protein [Chakrabartyella piscis]|uniref:hypothetical protein n=1 Tax=Chakrabartyella piscis TaxID=2918914 RepID=UPI002958A0FE|nr:hypothetical protein [Chakrabartyella piscis]